MLKYMRIFTEPVESVPCKDYDIEVDVPRPYILTVAYDDSDKKNVRCGFAFGSPLDQHFKSKSRNIASGRLEVNPFMVKLSGNSEKVTKKELRECLLDQLEDHIDNLLDIRTADWDAIYFGVLDAEHLPRWIGDFFATLPMNDVAATPTHLEK